MTALWWVLGVYLGLGLVIGVWNAVLHRQESWERLPEVRRRGWFGRAASAVAIVVFTASVWPWMFISGARKIRQSS